MRVYKVPQIGALADKYHGAGYALAATVGGQLVDMIYLADALPEFAELDEPGPAAVAAILDAPGLAPFVRQLQALGQVHVGMLSCWEFCEL